MKETLLGLERACEGRRCDIEAEEYDDDIAGQPLGMAWFELERVISFGKPWPLEF